MNANEHLIVIWFATNSVEALGDLLMVCVECRLSRMMADMILSSIHHHLLCLALPLRTTVHHLSSPSVTASIYYLIFNVPKSVTERGGEGGQANADWLRMSLCIDTLPLCRWLWNCIGSRSIFRIFSMACVRLSLEEGEVTLEREFTILDHEYHNRHINSSLLRKDFVLQDIQSLNPSSFHCPSLKKRKSPIVALCLPIRFLQIPSHRMDRTGHMCMSWSSLSS